MHPRARTTTSIVDENVPTSLYSVLCSLLRVFRGDAKSLIRSNLFGYVHAKQTTKRSSGMRNFESPAKKIPLCFVSGIRRENDLLELMSVKVCVWDSWQHYLQLLVHQHLSRRASLHLTHGRARGRSRRALNVNICWRRRSAIARRRQSEDEDETKNIQNASWDQRQSQ